MVDFVEARQPRSSWRSRSRIKNWQRLTYMKALGFFRSARFAAEMAASAMVGWKLWTDAITRNLRQRLPVRSLKGVRKLDFCSILANDTHVKMLSGHSHEVLRLQLLVGNSPKRRVVRFGEYRP